MTIRNSSGPRLCVRRGDDLVDVNSADNRIPPDLGAFLSQGGTIGDLSAVVVCSATIRRTMFPVAETIATITAAITLEPGDMIVMRTPSGVGYARRPPVYMKAGDVIGIEIEGVGTLRNQVVDEVRV